MRSLTVSRSSSRFIQQGHPWIRVDKFTRGLEQLKTGEEISLVDDRGKKLASALADPDQDICARVYHQRPDKAFQIEAALERARSVRQPLFDDDSTNCFRLVHGEADFLPGLRIELLADYTIITLRAPCIAAWSDRITTWCRKQFPNHQIIIKEQFDDLRKHPLQIYAINGTPPDPTLEICGQELGTQVLIQPAQHLATGIYIDQRATREFLRQHCAGKDIANAFAYTGLFSVSLLQAGAASAVDIDIAAPALETAARNASLNHVSDRHRTCVGDAIHYFSKTDQNFDIIILDPPTAAHGKDKERGQWILRKDYPRLLKAAMQRLRPDGLLVACCNTLGSKKQFRLREHIVEHAPEIQALENPPIGIDIPLRKGFPESRPYQLFIGKRTS